MEPTLYISFIIASIALVVVPGPNVTIIIANTISDGTRAGFMTVAGTQFGILMMFVALGLGLDYILSELSVLFKILRYIGAAYLMWLGWSLIKNRDNGFASPSNESTESPPRKNFFWQGFIVLMTNPKALLFLWAFVPQFVNNDIDLLPQMMILSASFIVIATLFDGAYAVAFGQFRKTLSARHLRNLKVITGVILIIGSFWLVLNRT